MMVYSTPPTVNVVLFGLLHVIDVSFDMLQLVPWSTPDVSCENLMQNRFFFRSPQNLAEVPFETDQFAGRCQNRGKPHPFLSVWQGNPLRDWRKTQLQWEITRLIYCVIRAVKIVSHTFDLASASSSYYVILHAHFLFNMFLSSQTLF